MSKLTINVDKQAEDIRESIIEIAHITQKTTLQSVVDYLRIAKDMDANWDGVIFAIESCMDEL